MKDGLTGFGPLLRVSLKQDGRNIAPWVMLISVLSVTSVLAYGWLFPDAASAARLVRTVGANPAFSLIFGPARDLTSADGFNAWRALALGGFFAGLMSILIVVRNSRAHEDSGQAELIASGVVGREARLAVAIGMAVVASFALGIFCSIVTILFGGGVANTITLAATFTASGLIFAGVAAVTVQIASESRTANSLAITVLGAAFLVRGYIDAVAPTSWTIWLSPLGWTQQVAPATENNWRPLLLCLALTAALVAVAMVLQSRRDFGFGLIPTAPGPARGGAVTSVWGLAGRLNRGPIISWTIALAILGVVFGFVSTSLGSIFASNADIAKVISAGAVTQQSLSLEFLLTLLKLAGIIASVYGVQVMMRVYAEESEYRVEPLLAGALSRPKYLASNTLIALVGPAVALVIGSVIIATMAARSDPTLSMSTVAQQGVAEVPALWVLVGLSVATVGANPRLRLVAWLGIVATFALTILGPILRLPEWILGISPLWHVPNLAAPSPDYVGLLAVSLVAIVLVVIGFAGFRRRDVM